MTIEEGKSSSPKMDNPKTLHQTYSVRNINTKVRTLDGVKIGYSTWVKLFEWQANAFKVIDHIDGTEPPEETATEYAEWFCLDSLVLQWIDSTISDKLLG